MLAVQNGQPALSDKKCSGPGGLLGEPVYLGAAPYTDMRLHDITMLLQLYSIPQDGTATSIVSLAYLTYTWTTDGCDPDLGTAHITQVLGEANPMDKTCPSRFPDSAWAGCMTRALLMPYETNGNWEWGVGTGVDLGMTMRPM
ncbi:MAG: hypothetical protein IPG74_12060 [Flavobacteriales bacterium]|nr:hypothetical protein [Flavobacteriales bacterium]